MTIQILAILVSCFVFVFVIELVRREKLTFKYAFAWLFFAGLGVVSAVFKEALFMVSDWLGFELASNFVFFILSGVFVVLSLLLTVFLCQQNKRNDRMVQSLGLLELELKQLQEKINGR